MYSLSIESIDLINKFINYYVYFNNNKLDKLYHYFEKYYKFSNYKLIYNDDIINNNIHNNLINSKYISKNIKESITKLKKYKNIKYTYNNINININIYYNDKNIDIFIKTIIIYINYMCNLINNNNKDINITYYLTDNIKIHNNDGILNSNNINTGLSTNNEIVIFRKEEILKTTIHELIHLMNIHYINDNNNIINHYNKKYDDKSNIINTFESFTDFWAILINIYLTTKLLNTNLVFFKNIIYIEKAFIIYQCLKMLYLKNKYKIKNLNKYTNITSYYIIKCEMFMNLENTLKYMKYNINNLNREDFYLFLKKLNKINYMSINENNNVYTTTRMSICELNLF